MSLISRKICSKSSAAFSFMAQVCEFDLLVVAPNGRLGNFYSILRGLVSFKFLNLHGILARITVGTSMVTLFILASGCELYSSLFSCCCLYLGGNKFSINLLARLFHQW